MRTDREKYFSYIFKSILGIFLFACIVILFFIFYKNYDGIVSIILKGIKMESKASEFKKSFFTYEKFELLKYTLLLFSILLLYLILKIKTESYYSYFQKVYYGFRDILVEIKKVFFELSIFQRICLLIVFILIIGIRLFYFFKYPLFIDEAFSYVYFVSKGLLVSASYYPSPNNHVFYSDLCCLAKLVFEDPLIIMRLPSIIISLLLCMILFLVVRKYYGFNIGLLTLVLFSFCGQIDFYSIQGRGYILLVFFVLVSGYSLLKVLYEGKEVYLFIFIVSSVLGFYTIPVFLYPFSSFVVYAFLILLKNKNWDHIFRFCFVISVVGILSLIFYLPVLLFNNFHTITGNPWVAPSKSFSSQIIPYLIKINDYLWNINGGLIITIMVLLGVVFLFLKTGRKHEVYLSILLIIVPLIMITIQKVLPFERIWLYLILPFVFGLAFIIVQIISILIKNDKVRNISFLIVTFIAISTFLLISVNSVLNKSFSFYRQMDIMVNKIYEMSPKSILADDFDSNTFIKYKYAKEKKSIYVESISSPSIKFDMIVTSKDLPQYIDPQLYILGFKNSYVKVYFLKNKFGV